MKKDKFTLSFILLFLLQIVLAKHCQIGPYIYVAIFPAMFLFAPTSMRPAGHMAIAFVCGLCVDFLSDGVPGLNASAAVLAAALQRPLITLCVDEEIISRKYRLSIITNDTLKCVNATILATAAYLLFYTILDGAGSRPLSFILLKFMISFAVSAVFNLLCAAALSARH